MHTKPLGKIGGKTDICTEKCQTFIRGGVLQQLFAPFIHVLTPFRHSDGAAFLTPPFSALASV